jgi:lipoprotein
MKRRILAATLVLLFPLGMAACGSQSKAAARREIDNAVTSANQQAEKKGQTTSRDPKVLRDRMADLTSSYKKASKKVKNKKVKPVFQSFIADMERIIELYDDGDTTFSSKEFDSAMTDMENHGKKLSDLCGFGWDIGS